MHWAMQVAPQHPGVPAWCSAQAVGGCACQAMLLDCSRVGCRWLSSPTALCCLVAHYRTLDRVPG
jgi:hypothetical protein